MKKRIITMSCFILFGIVFASCTNNDEDTISKTKLSISADNPDNGPTESGGDGQNGQTPIPPPKR